MSLRILRGTGLGALGGGGTAAATGDENQTAKQRLGRGILGGMAGAAAGAGIHGGLRYNKLRKMDVGSVSSDGAGGLKYTTNKMNKSDALDEAFLGSRSTKAFKENQSAANKTLKDQSGSEKVIEARQQAKRTQDLAAAHDSSNSMFAGMDSKAAKKLYRQKARELHPDSGGNPDDFQALNEAYKAFKASQTMAKTAFADISHLVYRSFFNNLSY